MPDTKPQTAADKLAEQLAQKQQPQEAPPKTKQPARDRVAELVQLYENTISSQGISRREEVHSTAVGETRLSHARYVLDRISQRARKENWSDMRVGLELGFVQGILWGEMVFSIPALADHVHSLSE